MNIKLPFGLRDNKLIHISEINQTNKGLKCNCVCPKCGKKLIARLGNKNIHHFAHYNENCKNALETTLHIFAKETLEKYKKIRLPEIKLMNYVYYKSVDDFNKGIMDLDFESHDLDYLDEEAYTMVTVIKERVLEFEKIEFEKRLDDIIPDIIVYYKNSPLLIEIAVTHPIDNQKIKKINQLGISAIEIDLNSKEIDYYTFDKQKIENLIINGTVNKRWIYNKVEEKEKLKLVEQNKLALEKMKKKLYEKRLMQEKASLEHMKLLEEGYENMQEMLSMYEKELSANKLWINFSKKYNIQTDNIPEYLNKNVEGAIAFGCDKRIWQSLIFENFILNRKGKIILTGNVVRWVEKYSPLPLNKEFVYTRKVNPKIADLTSAILNYLLVLRDYGFLKKESYNSTFYTKFTVLHDKFSLPENITKKMEPIAVHSENIHSNNNLEAATKEKQNNSNTKCSILSDKIGKCRLCGNITSDWIIYYGDDGTCICRSCRYLNK